MLVKRYPVAAVTAVVIAVLQTQSLWAQAPKAVVQGSANEGGETEIRAMFDALGSAFNSGKSADVAGFFLTGGELIDEAGNVYQGPTEIKELLDQYFQKFAGAKVTIELESVRFLGPVVIQEGTRSTTLGDATSKVQFTCVVSKTDQGYRIVSLRDFPEETLPTPGEQLQTLDWLVGDWVNEGADARVRISYQWSEDRNFLLGEFHVIDDGQVVSKSSHRIGWDPVLGKPRSWLFDSDGGFSEAVWTLLGDGRWIVRSSAVLPDGLTGSATLTITPADPGRFIYAGSSRLIGHALEDDFELTVVRKAPAAGISK
ncbi:MAG: SgcJ/EcaC family oxidoreductase [Planctomycetota bacterium]